MIASTAIQSEEVKNLASQLEQLDDNSKVLVMTYASALADREKMEKNRAREKAKQILASTD